MEKMFNERSFDPTAFGLVMAQHPCQLFFSHVGKLPMLPGCKPVLPVSLKCYAQGRPMHR